MTQIDQLRDDLAPLILKKPEQWEKLRGATILFAGGTGFYGAWLLKTLQVANEIFSLDVSAVVLTRNVARALVDKPQLLKRPDVTLIEGDIRSFHVPHKIDFAFHVASESYARNAPLSDEEQYEVIVNGTRRFLDVVSEAGCSAALFASSGAVYGSYVNQHLHVAETVAEDVAPNSRSVYGAAKWAAETDCRRLSSPDFCVTIARCFASVGPYLPLHAHFAIGNFVSDVLLGLPIHVSGDGSPYRSYLYMSDLSIWLWTILLNGRAGEAYNVGSEIPYRIGEVAEIVAFSGDPTQTVHYSSKGIVGAGSRYVPSTAKARTELNLNETVNLNTSINLTKRWYSRETLS